jgi:hypothetical protein
MISGEGSGLGKGFLAVRVNAPKMTPAKRVGDEREERYCL